MSQASAAGCEFSDGGEIRDMFKDCNPDIGIKPTSDINLKATDADSDFREVFAAVIRRIQILTSVVAIGVMVWIGLILVLPVSAEKKESAKSKVFSVAL